MAVPDLDAGRRAADDIAGTTGRPTPTAARIDLTDLDSVHAFAAACRGPLHALVLNSGGTRPASHAEHQSAQPPCAASASGVDDDPGR